MINVLRSFRNNKSPGNDGLTKTFYETFWNELKERFMISISNQTYEKLVISQRQTVIMLIEKNDKTKHFIKNWRPTLFQNFFLLDLKKCFRC